MSAFTPKFFKLFKNGYVRLNLRSDAIAGLTVAIALFQIPIETILAKEQGEDAVNDNLNRRTICGD